MNTNILITGAGNRIGAKIATDLARAGHNIIVHCNNSLKDGQALVETINSGGGQAALLCADLTNREHRAALIAEAREPFGALHALINNASIFEPDSALSVNEALWDRHFALHAEAPIFLARDFARQLPAETSGNIINIIDERVLRTNPAFFSYNLSKSVLWTATKTMAQSLAPHIRVNAIGPGPTLPNSRQSDEEFESSIASLPLKKAATPSHIAEAVIFLLNAPSITGQMIALDGGEHLEWRGRGGITPALE